MLNRVAQVRAPRAAMVNDGGSGHPWFAHFGRWAFRVYEPTVNPPLRDESTVATTAARATRELPPPAEGTAGLQERALLA